MSSEERLDIVRGVLRFSHALQGEYLFYCPYCNHHNPKMSVNIHKNVYKCWVCDTSGMDIWRIIRRFGDPEDKRRWRSVTSTIDASEQSIFDLFSKDESTEEEHVISLPDEFVSPLL